MVTVAVAGNKVDIDSSSSSSSSSTSSSSSSSSSRGIFDNRTTHPRGNVDMASVTPFIYNV